VSPQLELVARRFIHVGAAQNVETTESSGQGNWATHDSTSALGCFHDFEGGLIDQFVIESLEANANFLLHGSLQKRTNKEQSPI
jgi:hypothetical protein